MRTVLKTEAAPDSDVAYEQLIDDARWCLVQRIVVSATFSKTLRLSNFLSYVCERELLGRTDEITEHQIGIHVFGRPTDYNPGEDNIVRASARLLRQRLMQYFVEEGIFEPELIVIPRGTYVPVFEKRSESVAPSVLSPLPKAPQSTELLAPTEQEKTKPSLRGWIWVGAASLGLLLLIAAFVLPGLMRSPTDRLWNLLFPRGGTTLFIASDSGLVMLENMTHHAVNINAYSGGNYIDINKDTASSSEDLIRNIGQRRYTSIADMRLATSFAALTKSKNNTLDVKYARDINMDNLKHGNLVLSGDPQGNPWVALFDKELNFRFSMDDASAIHIVQNMHPLPGEQAEYRSFPTDPQHRVYALIGLTHNLDGGGHVLLIEGTTMAGLEAAQDFLFSDGALAQALRAAMKQDGMHDFEILLESKNIAAKASGFQVIATRIH
jgi:hypothetical protein